VTVYVDDMQMPAKVGRLTACWSHLMADSREELLAFGEALGLRASWLQDKRSGVHFDLTEPRRQEAIRRGAVPIRCGSEQWSRVVDEARQQYSGPDRRPRRFQ
jgi:hypothetical protein